MRGAGLLTSWEKPGGPHRRAALSSQRGAGLTASAPSRGARTVPSFPSHQRGRRTRPTSGAGRGVWSPRWQRPTAHARDTGPRSACPVRGSPGRPVRSLASGWPDGARGGQGPQTPSPCAQWAAPRHFPCDPGCGRGRGTAGKSFPQTCGLRRAPQSSSRLLFLICTAAVLSQRPQPHDGYAELGSLQSSRWPLTQFPFSTLFSCRPGGSRKCKAAGSSLRHCRQKPHRGPAVSAAWRPPPGRGEGTADVCGGDREREDRARALGLLGQLSWKKGFCKAGTKLIPS